MNTARLLVVDHDASLDSFYQEAARRCGVGEVAFERTVESALKRLQAEEFDVAIAAIDPEHLDGLALLESLRRRHDTTPVLLVAAKPSVEGAAAGMRLDAADYLARPLTAERLAESLGRVLEQERMVAERALLRRQVERPYTFDDIIGTCPALRKVFETIERVADSDVAILVVGETGTGKELVARSIHRRSRRKDK